ncbi:glycoside hydrolase [Russula emetica]|nr:glycoside hydrolase [Russula emetica]
MRLFVGNMLRGLFRTITSDVNTLGLAESDQQLLPQFVQTAKQNNVRPLLSIGGWGGSQYFSSSVATAANRTAFAQTVMKAVSQYELDGVEFDWEYPGKQGIGCNIMSTNDSANFLSFLQTLRSMSGSNLTISAAVSVTPFVGPDGNPLTDVSAFGQVLDYIEIMNYDIWTSSSSSVGPNAPLDDSCAPTPKGSAMSAVKAWTNAKFPANKMILGVAAYGHSYHVDSSAAYNSSGKIHPYVPFNKALQPPGDKWDATAGGVDMCGNPNTVGGVFEFWGLIDGGFLTANGTAANGIDYVFDQCSQTPFVYNNKTQVMVSYDDASSFTAKGKYIVNASLAGFATWETAGDSNDILLDAINSALGNTS